MEYLVELLTEQDPENQSPILVDITTGLWSWLFSTLSVTLYDPLSINSLSDKNMEFRHL